MKRGPPRVSLAPCWAESPPDARILPPEDDQGRPLPGVLALQAKGGGQRLRAQRQEGQTVGTTSLSCGPGAPL